MQKSLRLSINPFYGLIYGGITISIILVAVVITKIPLLSNTVFAYPKMDAQEVITKPALINPFVCTFKRLTNVPCLTCGGTRSIIHLSHLRLKQSFLMNPMIFLGFTGLLIWGIISFISIAVFGAKNISITLPDILNRLYHSRILIILLVGVIMINWAYLIFVGKP